MSDVFTIVEKGFANRRKLLADHCPGSARRTENTNKYVVAWRHGGEENNKELKNNKVKFHKAFVSF